MRTSRSTAATAVISATTRARVLERIRAEEPFVLEVVDIEQDPALHARYLERIPVVALDGDELFDFFVDERALLARLRGSIVSER